MTKYKFDSKEDWDKFDQSILVVGDTIECPQHLFVVEQEDPKYEVNGGYYADMQDVFK